MAETPSAMIPIGTKMPAFCLPDALGKLWQPAKTSYGTLVVFMCNHCPFVIHVANLLVDIHSACIAKDIEMCGINSNDTKAFPADSPEKMLDAVSEYGWEFPYLVDETQEIAKQFQATCTPDVFLYDQHGKLFYRGQFDSTRPHSKGAVDGEDLKDAIVALVTGCPPPLQQVPAIGCNIKWKE